MAISLVVDRHMMATPAGRSSSPSFDSTAGGRSSSLAASSSATALDLADPVEAVATLKRRLAAVTEKLDEATQPSGKKKM